MAINKCKYWWAICYLENMKENWKDDISDLLQVPYAYCIHDRCVDENGDPRKVHAHVMIAFPNTTTENHAKSVFKELEAEGQSMLINDKINRVINVRRAYDYLIHDTEDCRKKGKLLYPSSERIIGNNFDIGAYEQLGLEEKMKIRRELSLFLIEKQFSDYTTFYQYVVSNYDSEYENIVVSYQGHFDKLCKGCYHRKEKIKQYLQKEAEEKDKSEKEK